MAWGCWGREANWRYSFSAGPNWPSSSSSLAAYPARSASSRTKASSRATASLVRPVAFRSRAFRSSVRKDLGSRFSR